MLDKTVETVTMGGKERKRMTRDGEAYLEHPEVNDLWLKEIEEWDRYGKSAPDMVFHKDSSRPGAEAVDITNMQKAIGKRMREARKNRGVSQTKIEEIVGISASTIRRIEKGEHDIPISRLLGYSFILQVPIAVLLQDVSPFWDTIGTLSGREFPIGDFDLSFFGINQETAPESTDGAPTSEKTFVIDMERLVEAAKSLGAEIRLGGK